MTGGAPVGVERRGHDPRVRLRGPALACSVGFALLSVVGGCGGSGGGSVAEPPTVCIPTHAGDCVTRAVFERTANALVDGYEREDGFRNQWGLAKTGAGRAYANIEVLKGAGVEPGAGVTIGFIDTGIDRDHPAFAGKTVTEYLLPGAAEETGSDTVSHGTSVASVAAAGKAASPGAASGVAWGADVAMFAIPFPSVGDGYIPVSLSRLDGYDDEMALYLDTVLGWRDGARKVDILNLSFGANGIVDDYTEQQLRQNFDSAIAAMAQAGAGEKTILVWGAGNAHGQGAAVCEPPTPDCNSEGLDAVSVEVFPGLAARIAELRGHTVAVVALREDDGRIASFSNRCGIAADYCIAAPGEDMAYAYFGPDPETGEVDRGYAGDGSGTSLAAPMVAGGLALMKQIFRGQLSHTELVTRLFATADKGGVYADPAVYGQGAMDVGAATSPVGVLEVPVADAARSGFRLTGLRFRPGPALGDGMRRSLAGREIMALDELGAPFWQRLGNFTAAAAPPPVAARLRAFMAAEPADPLSDAGARGEPGSGRETAPLSLATTRLGDPAEIRGSHLALAEGGVKTTLAGWNGLSAAAFATDGPAGTGPASGASLGWRRAGSPVGLRAGWIGERKTLLGSVGEGAFGALAADTSFLGVDAAADLDGWRIGANAEFGLVAPAARGGLVKRVSTLATSAFALHAARPLAGSGMLRLSVSQPLRVERGRAWLSLPAGRTKEGAVIYSRARADLAPSGRQLDFAGQWRGPLAGGKLRLGAVLSIRPGHRQATDPEWTFLGGWRLEF